MLGFFFLVCFCFYNFNYFNVFFFKGIVGEYFNVFEVEECEGGS